MQNAKRLFVLLLLPVMILFVSPRLSSTAEAEKAEPLYGYFVTGQDMDQFKKEIDDLVKAGVNCVVISTDQTVYRTEDQIKAEISTLKYNGIKPYIKIDVFYRDGKWISPLTSPEHQVFRQDIIYQCAEEIKKYLALGYDGVVLDYIRFAGTAEKYGVDEACAAITEAVKQLSEGTHRGYPNAVLSVLIEPEAGEPNRYQYGQDITEISKYADLIIPRICTYDYGRDAKWICGVTKEFVRMSSGAAILSWIQAYTESYAPMPQPYQTLLSDAQSALEGGSNGVLIFRFGLSERLNFHDLSNAVPIDVPGTGDPTSLPLFLASALISAGLLIIIAVRKRRSR